MKVISNTNRSILSLYDEKTTSVDSCLVVEGLLEEGEACLSSPQEMTAFVQIPVVTKDSPRFKSRSTLHKKKPQIVILFMMLILALVVYVLAFLTTPEYLPYDKEVVTIKEIGNRTVQVQFGEEASGYDLNRDPSEVKGKVVYSLTAWDSIWNRSIAKTHINSVVLNGAGESIAAVYYVENGSNEDLLIYGNNPNPNGGVLTLPRLVLGYYALIALWVLVMCIVVLILFKRHKKVTDLTMKIFFLPVSYLLGQFLIKGVKSSSYHALRDFYFILLMMIPIYIAFLTALSLYKTYKSETIH